MGTKNFNIGSTLAVFFAPETSLLTPHKPEATEALRAISATIGRPQDYAFANDRRGGRSRWERVQLRDPVVPWSISCLLRPSGTAGTAPEIGDVLKHLMGSVAVVGGTSVTYSFLEDPTALSASIYVGRTHTQEGCYGAIVNKATINWGEGLATVSFSGEAVGYINGGYTTLSTGMTGLTTATVADASNFTPYSIVQVGSDTNTGAGYMINSISGNVLTLESAVTAATGSVVKAFLPDPTYVGNALGDRAGSLSLDASATTIAHLPSSLDIENGVSLLTMEAFQTGASDVLAAGIRNVSPKLNFLVARENNYVINDMRAKTTYDTHITIGAATAGARMKLDMPYLQFTAEDQDSPEEGTEKWSASGVALATSTAGGDELSIVFE